MSCFVLYVMLADEETDCYASKQVGCLGCKCPVSWYVLGVLISYWLVGWLNGWLGEWLVWVNVWLAAWLVGWLVG